MSPHRKPLLVVVLAVAAALASTACDEKTATNPTPDPVKTDPADAAGKTDTAGKTAAAGKTVTAGKTAAPDNAESDKLFESAAALALPMCDEELDLIKATSAKTLDEGFVAAVAHPQKIGGGGTAEEVMAEPLYRFIGQRAAVPKIYADSDGIQTVYVVIASDDTDPCTIDPDKLLSPKGNPAGLIELEMGVKLEPGDYQNWAPGTNPHPSEVSFGATLSNPGPGQSADTTDNHSSQGYIKVTKADPSGIELTVHSCKSQKGELSAYGDGVKHRYFALGTVKATFCPGVTPK